MNVLAAIAISLYGWIYGMGLAGAGTAWLPGALPAWRAQRVADPIALAQPLGFGRGPVALPDPWFASAPVAARLVAGVPARREPAPEAGRRRTAVVDVPAGATPPPPAALPVPTRSVRQAVPPALHGRAAAREFRDEPTPPPGGFMTQADYERAILSRLARRHPELAGPVRREIAAAIAERALAWGLDPWLVYADIRVESDFRPRTVGAAGEIGLMQVLPSTARMVAREIFGLRHFPARQLYDPAWNVRIGTAFLGLMMERHRGNVALALAVYNAGGAVTAPTGYTYHVLGVFDRVRTAGASDA